MIRMSSKKYPNVDDNKLNDGSKKAVYVALFGNLGITPVKAYCSSLYRKHLDVAKTMHSFSDTFKQILILIGIKKSAKAASERHPIGRSREQFFWSFIVATMIFGTWNSFTAARH